jgi:arylsulfatase A-like enzyme
MSPPRPNIILITTDQQRFDTVAALGNREIYTPHLDWLTDEGIAFTRAYTDCPICMPARVTLMTGRHGYSLGIAGNGGMARAVAGVPTLPGLLTAAGYQTRAVGKMHFEPLRCHYGFEHMELPLDYYRERHRRAHEGLPKEHGVGENEITPVISTVHETESLTHWTVRRTIDFLETRDDTRPFFLWTSFAKPHPPFDPCANYWALYANRTVAAPVHGDWSRTVADIPQGFLAPTYCLNNAWRMSEEQLRDVKRAYYACITQIDYSLGLLFARLREMKLLESTWIVFTSDHGDMLGDHHMGAKTVFLEGSAHVPLLVRPPFASWQRHPRAGERVDTLAQLADVMPSILAMAGLPMPEATDGVNLMDLPAQGMDRPFFGACAGQQYGIIQDRVKYCYATAGGGELLFDLARDPREERNLVREPACAGALQRLRAAFAAQLARCEPQRLQNGEVRADPPLAGPRDVSKWPGFHSTTYPCDVLH